MLTGKGNKYSFSPFVSKYLQHGAALSATQPKFACQISLSGCLSDEIAYCINFTTNLNSSFREYFYETEKRVTAVQLKRTGCKVFTQRTTVERASFRTIFALAFGNCADCASRIARLLTALRNHEELKDKRML